MIEKLTPENAFTVEGVARELGVTRRTVLGYVHSGQLRPVKYARPGVAGAAISLFHPDEVAKLADKRAAARTEVLPAGDISAAVGPVASRPSVDLARVIEALGVGGPVVAVKDKLHLSEEEAMEYTGWGKAALRRKCKGERDGPGGALVFKRKDLEKL